MSALTATAAALACGVVLGVASRVAMRAVAFDAGLTPGWSMGGTLEVVLFGVLIGAPVAAGHWWRRRRRRLPRGSGLLTGLLLYAGLALVPPPAARSALAGISSDRMQAVALVFALAFVVYGGGLDICWTLWFRCIPRRHDH